MDKEKQKTIGVTIPLDSGFTHILLNLAAQGYSHILVEYSGSGDSGGIEDMQLLPHGSVKESKNEDGEYSYKIMSPNMSPKKTVNLENECKDFIENIIYTQILNSLDDWWNNEGGGGNLLISTLDGSYKTDHYVNIMSTVDSVITGKMHD